MLLAGERPGGDPLAGAFGLKAKALIPVAGEPMFGRVVATLLATPDIARIVILAQEPDNLLTDQTAWIAEEPRVAFARSGSGISTSVAAVAGSEIAPWPVLVTTADHPLLSPEILSEFMENSQECDVCVGVVERGTLTKSYPENKRTWLRFSDGDYSGANLFALRGERAGAALTLWSRVEANRKEVFKLFWKIGPVLGIRAMTRTISLGNVLKKVGKTISIHATFVALSSAEAAIDVDKWSDLQLVEKILTERRAAGV